MVSVKKIGIGLGILSAALLAACSTSTSNTNPKNISGAAFGKPISEQALVLWNIDIRTQDGQGLPRALEMQLWGKKYITKNARHVTVQMLRVVQCMEAWLEVLDHSRQIPEY